MKNKTTYHIKCEGPFFCSEFEGTERKAYTWMRKHKRIHDANIKTMIEAERDAQAYSKWTRWGYRRVRPRLTAEQVLPKGQQPLKVIITRKEAV